MNKVIEKARAVCDAKKFQHCDLELCIDALRQAVEEVDGRTFMPIPERNDIGWFANLTLACIDEGVDRATAERVADRFMGWLVPDPPEVKP